jgi:murein DD-endopeptidase MepM/ murein hydrolase activator NlpD
MKFIVATFVLLYRSSKLELKIIGATLLVLIVLPLMAVVVFAHAGIALISEALVSANPTTQAIEVFDPDGNVVVELEVSTTWPVRGYISDEFGSYHPFRRLLGLGTHSGIDIANAYGRIGDPVTPFMEGVVARTNPDDVGHCGKSVRIAHGHNIESLYCHLDRLTAVRAQTVTPGDVIGYMGNTGTSTGPHLHFQVEVYGIAVNPRVFVAGEPEGSGR